MKLHVYAVSLEGETETPSFTVTISCRTCPSTCSFITNQLDTALGFIYQTLEFREE